MKCYMGQALTSSGSPPPLPWDVIITEWALGSYLDLKSRRAFTDQEYWTVLRPDVELLQTGIPSSHPKFANAKFWGPATQCNVVLPGGYKMKWHQMGPGQIQLRLPVMAGPRKAFLCEAYVKANVATERRQMARFKTQMNLISLGRYIFRGKL